MAIPRAVDIRRVAEWAGTSVDEIQALNPELRRWTTPVKYPEYEVKVPVGSAERLSARLAEAGPSDFTTLKWYTVKKRRHAAERRAEVRRLACGARRSEQPEGEVALCVPVRS